MADVAVAVTFENTGPPPHASGEDWAAYFRAYRAGLDAKAAEKAEKARLVAENGKFSVSAPGRLVEPQELSLTATGRMAGPLAFATLLEKHPTPFVIQCQVSETHHEPTVYVEDAKSKNENDEKGHVAGDERYPAHDERHESVGAAVGDAKGLAVRVEAYWTRKKEDGAMGFEFAKTYVRGIGWDFFLSGVEFTEWQYMVGLKPRPKPKEKPAEAVSENGEWHG